RVARELGAILLGSPVHAGLLPSGAARKSPASLSRAIAQLDRASDYEAVLGRTARHRCASQPQISGFSAAFRTVRNGQHAMSRQVLGKDAQCNVVVSEARGASGAEGR